MLRQKESNYKTERAGGAEIGELEPLQRWYRYDVWLYEFPEFHVTTIRRYTSSTYSVHSTESYLWKTSN